MSIRDTLQALLVTLLWALCYPLISLAIADAPPLSIGAWRALIAGCALLTLAKWQKRKRPSLAVFRAIALAGFGLATLGFAGMFLAGGRVSPGIATVLSNIQPLLAVLIGLVVLAESITRSRGFVLMLGFIGIVATALPSLLASDGQSSFYGVAFVGLGALGVAIGNIVLKHMANQIDPIVAAGWALILGAVPLWGLTIAMNEALPYRVTPTLIATVFVLAIFGTALALVLWLDLLRRYDLVRVNVFSFMTTVFALLIGAVFFEERWSASEWIGIVITMMAVVGMVILPKPVVENPQCQR
tara:strand:- start:29387 stop:30286 length:900 start_codon:yes stop_codon:yes gene_type:complete